MISLATKSNKQIGVVITVISLILIVCGMLQMLGWKGV